MTSRILFAIITLLVLGLILWVAAAEGPPDDAKTSAGPLQAHPTNPLGPPDSALVTVPPGVIAPSTGGASWPRPRFTDLQRERDVMVAELRRDHRPEVDDARVLAAMAAVPRDLFVPENQRQNAYQDSPLPIGEGQTISQPYIVALMTQLADVDSTMKVLEVGTGSGYQAAVLSELTPHVFTIEIVPELARRAAAAFTELGYTTIEAREGDGYAGWPSEAPFDRILVTAAPEEIPAALVAQLKPGGRMIVPVGPRGSGQDLVVVTKDASGRTTTRDVIPVVFVPMVHGKP
jgi:protein-L-isoaspartate(D-aspartate) O-methyltransferase